MSIKQHLSYNLDNVSLHTNLVGLSTVTVGSADPEYDLAIIGGNYDADNPAAASITARTLELTDHTNANYTLSYATGASGSDPQGTSAGVLRIGGVSNCSTLTYEKITVQDSAGNSSTLTPSDITTTGTLTADSLNLTTGGTILIQTDSLEIKSDAETYSSVTASSFYATSDRRLKENITENPVDCKNIITNICLNEFNFINDPAKITYLGVIAQELQEVLPANIKDSIVCEGKDGYLTVNEGKLGYITIGAVQRLIKENEDLKERVATLEEKIEKLLG